jgi:hypothetical protein
MFDVLAAATLVVVTVATTLGVQWLINRQREKSPAAKAARMLKEQRQALRDAVKPYRLA